MRKKYMATAIHPERGEAYAKVMAFSELEARGKAHRALSRLDDGVDLATLRLVLVD